jgi:hypothetical protein
VFAEEQETKSAITDENGYYWIKELTPGVKYTLKATKEGYLPYEHPEKVLTGTVVNFSMERALISGKVTEAYYMEVAIEGVLVKVFEGDTEKGSATTDADGNYEISGLSAGVEYTLKATKEGYLSYEQEKVFAGDIINFEMKRDVFEVYNYPNPVRTSEGTTIKYILNKDVDDITLRIYNIAGELVWEAKKEKLKKKVGAYDDITWDCKNDDEKPVASGIYIILLVADGEVATNKIAVIK